MMFFNFVAEHWIVSLAVYVILFWRTARRFDERMSHMSWFQKIYDYDYGILRQRMGVVRFLVVRFLSILIGLAVGPIFWVLLGPLDRMETQKEKQRQQEYDKKQAERQQRIAEWKKANPPVLYYNTMAGITAVVRQNDYERAVTATNAARINGFWENEHVLMIICQTYLFIHKSAQDHVPEHYRAGWFSDFEDFRQMARVERKEDIFVPLASEGILLFEKQKGQISELNSDHPSTRLKMAWDYLRYQIIPAEVIYGATTKSEALA